MTAPGQLIVLNGVSSSGKTSIARELLRVLDRPYFHLSVDAFGAMRSPERTDELAGDELRRCSGAPGLVSIAPWPGWRTPATTSSSTTC